MAEKRIHEGKIIAEFINMDVFVFSWKVNNALIIGKEEDAKIGEVLSYFEPDRNWNILMEVTCKIASILHPYAAQTLLAIQSNIPDREKVYEIIIQFLKWYKSNTQTDDKTEEAIKTENKTPCKPRVSNYPPGETDYL